MNKFLFFLNDAFRSTRMRNAYVLYAIFGVVYSVLKETLMPLIAFGLSAVFITVFVAIYMMIVKGDLYPADSPRQD